MHQYVHAMAEPAIVRANLFEQGDMEGRYGGPPRTFIIIGSIMWITTCTIGRRIYTSVVSTIQKPCNDN